MNGSRRDFIRQSLITTAGLSIASQFPAVAHAASATRPGRGTINLFSKNLHWLDYKRMAEFAAELGFDGIDLTVRPEGHVIPERVAEDLPRAVEIVRKAGLNVYMIATAITDADDPFNESILKAAGALGIGYYRMGWISYDDKKTMQENLDAFKIQMTKFAALNKKYQIRGDYQNHSGVSFGSPVWDLWTVLKDIDPEWIGSQFDVMHAQVEGGNTWPMGLKLLKSYIKTIDIKDFIWAKNETGWKTEVVPLGQGMIDYRKYLQLLKQYELDGPFSMHFEYALGGVENGARQLTISPDQVKSAMKKDLTLFRQMLKDANIH